ncbi:MAG: putative selenate reductase subunit YgfK [Gammaproteobacteria bacterium]|nr:putative selenate reductase subunit YgfK [Gammaproteobacteria bacterium]MDH3578504.1 putative selenate reductase subunit YgfK [Gammaproteobacteria bacterium]
MSELFRPISIEQLASWLFAELESRNTIFGIPRQHFFVPRTDAVYRTSAFGHPLDTPFGPAAGPHSQMAQNIVTAWLCGARYIELKTVQTIDELDVSKPCIDMEDEGYNVEWSQELKVYQSFDEYLRAWVLIHALHDKLGFPGSSPALVFNLSVGYNLEGLLKPNMQWFLNQMYDCSDYKQSIIDQVAAWYPPVRELDIPDCISDNVTLSTMHGCPPDEIESICTYLLRERHLHTLVKCNPTLLGPERVRTLLNKHLKFTDVIVPDIAFEHDLKYSAAVPMLGELRKTARECGLQFGVKLSNTLEVENVRPVFDSTEEMSYLSGRPLHAITVNLARRLAQEFDGDLPMSFSAGASCFNAPDLLAAGMQTITVCSDLLKTGGYLRLLDYIAHVDASFRKADASGIGEFILRSANSTDSNADIKAAALFNLRRYADAADRNPDYAKDGFDTSHTKTSRALGLFDCIKAPCVDECPLDQKVPRYMNAVRQGDIPEARRVIQSDNPLPCILGRVCDHLCEQACIRTHLDDPLAIRDIKRYVMDHAPASGGGHPPRPRGKKVAIIGAGPGGISAAIELARGGLAVEIFEQHAYPGGMVGGVVPEYRLPQSVFDKDFGILKDLGVKVHYKQRVGRDIQLSQLRRDGFDHVVIMVGAQLSKALSLAGEACVGVVDGLQFLRQSRENHALDIGKRVGVIGAGDTAMDCGRVARRHNESHVTLIYRRTLDQMPADREEITQLIAEGIEVLELSKPQRLVVEDGKLQALQCRRMTYAGDRDASGRKVPHEVPDSDFELQLDTLILAISQHAVLDFFDQEPIEVNDRGYIQADPVTFETSVRGVYAGGDVANDGPSSIVKAAAAGKAIADAILGRHDSQSDSGEPVTVDTAALLRRRSQKQRRVSTPHTELDDRDNFNEVLLTYSGQQAKTEASRCLDCDTFCSICVGVCPNLALLTYESGSFDVRLPELRFENNDFRVEAGKTYRAKQPFQVAVLTDLCNECGNCTTFCPTSGQPYRDKPRLYLDRADFEEQSDNAFIVSRDEKVWALEARWQGANHRIELNGKLDYTGPSFCASIDPQTFTIERAQMTGRDDTCSLEPCAAMFVLLKGLQQSVPFLPTALPPDVAASGRIAHPGYEE